ncbi:MAG: GGDEF domain-containing protein [Planctomycetota bacterium]|jgi:diguanylate cyclase|nr:GGDEF domain-containing protein [Planctomycetota bacterium]
MDIGLPLILGLAIGAAFGMTAFAIVLSVRKARAAAAAPGAATPKTAMAGSKTAALENPAAKTSIISLAELSASSSSARRTRGETSIRELLVHREAQLGNSVFEVRELMRNLGDVITKTNTASAEAAVAFDAAHTNLEGIAPDDEDALISLHSVLLEEVGRVRDTNQWLRSELAEAKKGIEEQRRQIEELKSAVRADTLTKLPNRAAFDERIREFRQRLDRTGEIFTLLMLDIDHFKEVNDTYGHLNGDRVLKGVAMKLRESVRGNDVPCRLGGEEFAVLLPNTRESAARAVAERVRADLQKTIFKLDDNTVRITISGGLSEAWPGMDCPEALIKRADKALYNAKAGGRNRIDSFDETAAKA